MKKGVLNIFFGIVFLLFAIGIVIAIPNPASTYCEEMDYTANNTHCIFDDNNSCEIWSFYNNSCGAEYVKNLSCAAQGQYLKPGHVCCDGLKGISNEIYAGKKCISSVGAWNKCQPCGNSVCDTGENYCNCAEDCPITSTNKTRGNDNKRNVTNESIKERTRERIRNVKFIPYQKRNESDCLDGCTCHGAVMSCPTATGKVLTITAGNSGKTIIITHDKTNFTTEKEVEIYVDENNKTIIKTTFKDGNSVEIKVMPETAAAKAISKLKLKYCNDSNNCTIEMKELTFKDKARMIYQVRVIKESRFLWFFKAKKQVMANIDAETGEEVK